MPIACAEPWSYEVLSAGWKEVSLRLSKPWPNSISGVEQLPKSAPPVLAELLEEDAADEAEEAAVAVAVAEESADEADASEESEESDDEDESDADVVEAEASADELADAEPLEPVPADTTLPWLSITSWEAKS